MESIPLKSSTMERSKGEKIRTNRRGAKEQRGGEQTLNFKGLIAAVMDSNIFRFLNSHCHCHGQRHFPFFKLPLPLSWTAAFPSHNLSFPIAAVMDSGITPYFSKYFCFQTNLIIFFKTNYFRLKLYILFIPSIPSKLLTLRCK